MMCMHYTSGPFNLLLLLHDIGGGQLALCAFALSYAAKVSIGSVFR